MASNNGSGGNPRFGRDTGSSPPQQPTSPFGWPFASWPYLQYPYAYPHLGPYGPPYIQAPPTSNIPGIPQMPAPHPRYDPDFRSCVMENSTGGSGCEPGYNYFFPGEHTKILVCKTGSTPPWQLPPHHAFQFHACQIPVNTTVAELLKGFGATNPVPAKNKVTEVTHAGSGKWYKGIEIRGCDLDMVKMTLKDLGWDKTRTGWRGEKPPVYLYITKD